MSLKLLDESISRRAMNILSLFDGMSCGQIALNRLGIKYDNYYACEIDKYAIQVTQHNYPNTIQLGDVTKWKEWDIDWSSISLVTAGFPCQTWSVAGKQLGDRDERGMLFWTMLDIMTNVLKHNRNAKFLIENVKMKQEFEQYITFHTERVLGKVHKYLINSSLVSAQNRQRYYWTNIPNVTVPEDKKIFLKDIIDCGQVDRDKSHCLDANYFKGGNLKSYFEKHRRQLVFNDVSYIPFNYSSSGRGNGKVEGRFTDGNKALTLTATGYSNRALTGVCDVSNLKWRKLTPEECEKLQTVPVGYTSVVSNSQRYRMLGNGWTIDVITHILKSIKEI